MFDWFPGIGSFSSGRKVVCAKPDTLLCDVIDMLVDNKISCVPIVDDDNHPIEVYSTTNATTPVAKSSIDMCMTMPVSHFLFTETGDGETSTGNTKPVACFDKCKSPFVI